MADLNAILGPQAPVLSTSLIPMASTAADAQEDAGLESQRALKQYQGTDLPKLQNYYSGRGTYWSGQARVAADQLRDQYDMKAMDIQRLLARQMSDLRQKALLAGLGVSVGG